MIKKKSFWKIKLHVAIFVLIGFMMTMTINPTNILIANDMLDNDVFEVPLNATFEDMKELIEASALQGSEITIKQISDQINWDELKTIDTSIRNASYEVNLKVMDELHNEVSKTITIIVADGSVIRLPRVNKVVNEYFDPYEDVYVFDGNGKIVDPKELIVDTSKVDLSKPGKYDVIYTYHEPTGKTVVKMNTIRVYGDIQFSESNRVDLIEKEGAMYMPKQKAYYLDFNNQKVALYCSVEKEVSQGVVGKQSITYQALHPVNKKVVSGQQDIYVHGDIVFATPDKVKYTQVNKTLNSATDVSATYLHVNDDGSISKKSVAVNGEDVTSDVATRKVAKVWASVQINENVTNTKETSVVLGFQGLPQIRANTNVHVIADTSKEALLKAINAHASKVMDDGSTLDLTSKIDYRQINKIALHQAGSYDVRISVVDQEGQQAFVDITIVVEKKQTQTTPPTSTEDKITPPKTSNTKVEGSPTQPNQNKTTIKTEETIIVAIKDIPLSKIKKEGLSESLLRKYISVYSKDANNASYTIVASDKKAKQKEHSVTIQLADGTQKTLQIEVVDDLKTPKANMEKETCTSQYWMALVMLVFGVYAVYEITKQKREKNKGARKTNEK